MVFSLERVSSHSPAQKGDSPASGLGPEACPFLTTARVYMGKKAAYSSSRFSQFPYLGILPPIHVLALPNRPFAPRLCTG
ncbi:Uncharacterised protein [Bordetella pertussis]|nr:hypothetical protein L564_2509 [Bordetella pertussis CHLA-15]CFP59512.1 Uncharacterised protein [Bordetella pertussis]